MSNYRIFGYKIVLKSWMEIREKDGVKMEKRWRNALDGEKMEKGQKDGDSIPKIERWQPYCPHTRRIKYILYH